MTGMLQFFIPLTVTVNFVFPAFFPVITSFFLLTLTAAIFLFAIFTLIFFLPAFFTLIVVFFLTVTVTCFLFSFTFAAAALVTPVPGIGIILSTNAPANTQAAVFLHVPFFISISFLSSFVLINFNMPPCILARWHVLLTFSFMDHESRFLISFSS